MVEENTMPISEFAERMRRQDDNTRGKLELCVCCGKEWMSGDYNFYGLCDECFKEYNEQKYGGPFKPWPEWQGLEGNDLRLYPDRPYFMSVEKWIAYFHPNES